MDMGSLLHQFLQQLINGISLGSIYALIALGYTMIYGILKLINFAHGDIYMLGAYFGFVATTMLGFSFVPAIIFAMVGAAIAGIIIERIAYRPMRNAPRIAILITAIGVSFLLEYGMMLIATPQPRTFPAVFAADVYHFPADCYPCKCNYLNGYFNLHRAVHQNRQSHARRIFRYRRCPPDGH